MCLLSGISPLYKGCCLASGSLSLLCKSWSEFNPGVFPTRFGVLVSQAAGTPSRASIAYCYVTRRVLPFHIRRDISLGVVPNLVGTSGPDGPGGGKF
jgi:hypothetical protein